MERPGERCKCVVRRCFSCLRSNNPVRSLFIPGPCLCSATLHTRLNTLTDNLLISSLYNTITPPVKPSSGPGWEVNAPVLDTIKQTLVLDIELFKIRSNTSNRLLSTRILWSAERPAWPAYTTPTLTTAVSWGTRSLSSLSSLLAEWSPGCCTWDSTPLKDRARFSSPCSDWKQYHDPESGRIQWNKVYNKRLCADAKYYLRLLTILNKFQRRFFAKIHFS